MNIIETNLQFEEIKNRTATKRIIIHHADASVCDAAIIHCWHKQNGWSGIGYHFLVRKSGYIERGRPEDTIGAHALGSNAESLGICFEGDYNLELMPILQKNAGKELIAWLKNKYKVSFVQKHSDVCNTNCPGTNFPYEELIEATNNIRITTYNVIVNNGNWYTRLQNECNRQGFSSQKVDGIPGPITLAGCPMLKIGAKGGITQLLIERLCSLGGSCPTADDIFDSDIKIAVMKFQKANGLTADGIVGPLTWSRLLKLS